MIIYTHEDVLKMMNTFHTSELNRDLCMAKLTPIQLPQQEISDEEIEKEASKLLELVIYTFLKVQNGIKNN
jgi:hypothetical protein